jgi:hypothetical protein
MKEQDMAKQIVPAKHQANTDMAVRWIAGLLLVICLGFATNVLLDQVTTPEIATSTTSSAR